MPVHLAFAPKLKHTPIAMPDCSRALSSSLRTMHDSLGDDYSRCFSDVMR